MKLDLLTVSSKSEVCKHDGVADFGPQGTFRRAM